MKAVTVLVLLFVASFTSPATAQRDCDAMAHYRLLDGRPEQYCLSWVEVKSTPETTLTKIRDSKTRAMEDMVVEAINRYPIECFEPHDIQQLSVTNKRTVGGTVSGSLSTSFKLELGAYLLDALSLGEEFTMTASYSGEVSVAWETSSTTTVTVYQMDCHDKIKKFFKIKSEVSGKTKLVSVATWTLGASYYDAEGIYRTCAEGTQIQTTCNGGTISGSVEEVTELVIEDEQTPCCHPLEDEVTPPAQPCCFRICQ
jgi:hypothetical protein